MRTVSDEYDGHRDPNGWTRPGAQATRFDAIFRALADCGVSLDGAVVHDAGCGTGDLRNRLPAEAMWVGTDARAIGPGLVRDLMVDAPVLADVTVVSGLLAFYPTEAALVLLGRLWRATRVALAFNHCADVGGDREALESWARLHGCGSRLEGYAENDVTWCCVRAARDTR